VFYLLSLTRFSSKVESFRFACSLILKVKVCLEFETSSLQLVRFFFSTFLLRVSLSSRRLTQVDFCAFYKPHALSSLLFISAPFQASFQHPSVLLRILAPPMVAKNKKRVLRTHPPEDDSDANHDSDHDTSSISGASTFSEPPAQSRYKTNASGALPRLCQNCGNRRTHAARDCPAPRAFCPCCQIDGHLLTFCCKDSFKDPVLVTSFEGWPKLYACAVTPSVIWVMSAFGVRLYTLLCR
jgi:hypothetical protein